MEMKWLSKSLNLQAKQTRRNAAISPKLHKHKLASGTFLCYRQNATGATWTGRWHQGNSVYRSLALGLADDTAPADGIHVFSFDQAAAKVLAWAAQNHSEQTNGIKAGPYGLYQALDDYLADLKTRKDGSDHSQTASVIESKIKAKLPNIQLKSLTRNQVEHWYQELVTNGNSKATANRNLTVFTSALNYAYHHDRLQTKWWDKIKKFKGASNARARYLTVEECVRLIEVCPQDFKQLVRAALHTGCRYGELTALRVDAFNPKQQTLHIVMSKSGKPRTLALKKEGAAFFADAIKGKDEHDLIFRHTSGRHKGEAWKRTQQTFHMVRACEAAKIEHCGFHILRHSVASWLKMNHADSMTVARQLGHRDTRMVELHYGHLEDTWFANEVRSKLPSVG